MNERIRELALQSANEIADLFNPGFFDDRMVTDVADINKRFAELIVRECMTNLYLNGYDDAVIQIQKHFGVE